MDHGSAGPLTHESPSRRSTGTFELPLREQNGYDW